MKEPTREALPSDIFRILVESVRDYAIFMLDPEGKITTWNAGAKRVKGYESHEIIGQHFSVFYSKEEVDSGKPARELVEAIEIGKFEEEGWRFRKDGSRLWANVVITRLNDDAGKFIGFAKVTRDLTERKAAEESLKTANHDLLMSRTFVDSILENIPNMVFVKDAKDLRFVRFNRAGEDLIGHPRESLLGKNDYDLFTREQADFFTEKDRAVLTGKTVVDIPEEFIETKNRGRRILHTRKIPIFDNSGKPEYLLGISEDITEWKEAEGIRLASIREQAALEERERSTQRMIFLAEASTLLASSLDYRNLLERVARLAVPTLGDWCTITIVGPDGKRQRVAAVHGDPEKSHLIEELDRYYPIEADQTQGISEVIRTGKTQLHRIVPDEALAKAAKDERHLSIMRNLGCASSMLVQFLVRGKVHGAMSFVSANPERLFDEHDQAIAEELGKRAGVAIDNSLLYEAAQNAVRARDEFLSIASHELKTPITSLKLQLQMARKNTNPAENRAPSPEKIAKMLDVSNTQVTRLTALIDDLLDVSRIGAGKLSFRFERIDLSVLVVEMVDRYFDHLASAGCAVSVDSPTPLWILGDRFRIEQVIVNLLSNTAKYAKGKPVVVSTRRQGEYAEIICRDHGMGIPAGKYEKIFERFERADPSQTASGLGLGLYITREIVNAHDGKIRAEPAVGGGTQFVVSLPLAEI